MASPGMKLAPVLTAPNTLQSKHVSKRLRLLTLTAGVARSRTEEMVILRRAFILDATKALQDLLMQNCLT